MKASPWYAELFGEEFLRLYRFARPTERTRTEVEDLLQLLDLSPGNKILDLCCGYGRHSIEIARRGYSVTGFDLSEYLLTQAKLDAERAGVEIDWVQGDMRALPFANEFDAVINMFDSFGYLESEKEDQRVLEQVHKALRPNGPFLQEIPNIAAFVRTFQALKVSRSPVEDEVFIVEERDFDLVQSRLQLRIKRLGPDYRHNFCDANVRLYSPPEILNMLRNTGLEVKACYGGLGRTPLTLDSTFLVVLSSKTAP